jgi:alpha-L-fucosidase 2
MESHNQRTVEVGAKICLLFLSLLTAHPALAQSQARPGAACPAISVGNPQGNYITPGSLGDIPYKGRLTMDVYAPQGDPRPAAVIIHGSRGNKRGFVTRLYEQAAKAGYAWFAPDFTNTADVLAALQFIRCPGRFNITRRLVLIGEDTGAGIALNLTAMGALDGVATVGAKLSGSAKHTVGADARVLMIHGTEDEEFPISRAEAFCRTLKNCILYPEKSARHVFENWLPSQWDYREELDAWLRNDRRGLWKDIAYARPGGRDLLMDAWIPEGRGPFPAVIIAHGGGWEGGDKITYVAPVFEPLAKANIAWFSIDYTLLPYARNDQQLEDLRTAIRYVKTHARRYHVDPNKIAIFGESASGQMVTQVAAEPCDGCEVQSVICFYGVYRFLPPQSAAQQDRLDRMFGPTASEQEIRRYSPYYNARAGMPPVLIVQGTQDRLMSGSQEYAARLKELGVRSELLLIDGAPHGLENWENHPEWAIWKTRLVEWLKSTLNASPSH